VVNGDGDNIMLSKHYMHNRIQYYFALPVMV